MDLLVYADWKEVNGPRLMGTLSVTHTKGREVFTFAYSKSWVESGLAQNIDPDNGSKVPWITRAGTQTWLCADR